MTAETNYREYQPDSRFSDGMLMAARHLLQEFSNHRSHVRSMFMQEFRNSYEGTRLGVLWNIFLPLLPVTVYVMLASLRVVPAFEHVPSALAIPFNVTLWFLFAACVTMPISVVKGRNAEAMKTSLPLSTTLIASFARTLFETFVRFCLVVLVALVLLQAPAASAPLALIVMALGVAFFIGVGLLASILNIVVPDVQRVLTALLQYGVFLSGVIFPMPSLPVIGSIDWANPFYVFIQAARELMWTGWPSQPYALAFWSGASVLLLLFALRIFYVMEHRIRGVL